MNNNTIVDFGQNGEILAIELLDVSRIDQVIERVGTEKVLTVNF